MDYNYLKERRSVCTQNTSRYLKVTTNTSKQNILMQNFQEHDIKLQNLQEQNIPLQTFQEYKIIMQNLQEHNILLHNLQEQNIPLQNVQEHNIILQNFQDHCRTGVIRGCTVEPGGRWPKVKYRKSQRKREILSSNNKTSFQLIANWPFLYRSFNGNTNFNGIGNFGNFNDLFTNQNINTWYALLGALLIGKKRGHLKFVFFFIIILMVTSFPPSSAFPCSHCRR